DFDLSDILSVHVSVTNGAGSPDAIIERLQARLRVRPEVVISTEEEIRKQVLTGQSRKVNRFIDRRNN
ncbi:MAG: phenylacetate--CoA ligase family protein, partial [Nitrospirota bacterium]